MNITKKGYHRVITNNLPDYMWIGRIFKFARVATAILSWVPIWRVRQSYVGMYFPAISRRIFSSGPDSDQEVDAFA